MEIKKPIMIACAGRSGSTLYYRLLARHKDLGWLSTYNQVFPSQTWLSIFSRLYGIKIFDRIKHSYFFPKPFSPYKFWEQYLPGITRHDRPLMPEDVPDESIEPLRNTIAKVLKYQHKKRFLMKVTGWARMAYFNRIFPDAFFIYLKREPISVISSWVNAGWLNMTSELDSEAWEWGEVPAAYREIYKELGGGPLLSAAVKTQLDIDDLRRNAALFSGRCYQLNYEDLVAEPHKYLRETLEFCELDWDEDFENVINAARIRNYTTKWKQYLSEDEGYRVLQFFERTNTLNLATAPDMQI